MLIGILDCQTIEIHRTDLERSLCSLQAILFGAYDLPSDAPYVDHDLIAGTETIILRSGEILAGTKVSDCE